MKEFGALDQSKLAALTVKAIGGTMDTKDFAAFGALFSNVKVGQYSNYLKEVLPSLSDDALHKLVAGVLNYSAGQAHEANTFLRRDDIAKGLLVAEAERHGFKVELAEDGVIKSVPIAIPNATREHFDALLQDHPGVFSDNNGQLNAGNIRTSMGFNLFNSVVLSKLNELNFEPLEVSRGLKTAQEMAANPKDLNPNLEAHLEQIVTVVDGKPKVLVGDIEMRPMAQPLSQREVAEVAGAAVKALSGLAIEPVGARAAMEQRSVKGRVDATVATQLAEELAVDAQTSLMPKSAASRFSALEKSGLGSGAPAIIQAIHDDVKNKKPGEYIYIPAIKASLQYSLKQALSSSPELVEQYGSIRNAQQRKEFRDVILKQLKDASLEKGGVEDSIQKVFSAAHETLREGLVEEDKKEEVVRAVQPSPRLRKRDRIAGAVGSAVGWAGKLLSARASEAQAETSIVKLKNIKVNEKESVVVGDQDYVSTAIGSNYMVFNKETMKYERPKGEAAVYDAARAEFINGYVVVSIADGHGHNSEGLAELVKDGVKEANRALSEELLKSPDSIDVPNILRNMNSKLKSSIEYDGAESGVSSYAAKQNEDGSLGLIGFAVGDQMIVAYSPSQGFINISPSQQMGGSPETFFGNDSEKKATSQFKRNDLPGDAIVISMTDGIFDGLDELGLLKDSKSEDGKFSFQELDVDKMNARYYGQGIDSAQGIKEAIMLDTQIEPVIPEELQLELQTKQAQVNSMVEELEKFKGSQNDKDELGRRTRKLAEEIHYASKPKGDDLTIVAIELSNLIRERARDKGESVHQR
jgi:hypothetical protein